VKGNIGVGCMKSKGNLVVCIWVCVSDFCIVCVEDPGFGEVGLCVISFVGLKSNSI